MKRVRIINILIGLALLTGLASCAVTDIDRAVDFNNFRTFTWGKSTVEVKNPVYKSELIDKNIRRTIAGEFAKRGITYTKKDADLMVSYQTYTENKQSNYGG